MTSPSGSLQFALYLPRVLLRWQAQEPEHNHLELDGTLLFADVSGFTALSEELAAKGRVGSEEVTEVINGAFSEMLDVASLDGGDLLKFGGDALLLLYVGDDHAARAARSAFDMRDALEQFQEERSPVPLAMSVGIASGVIHLFTAGAVSQELIIAGPAAAEVLAMEAAADAGEILLAPSAIELIDDDVTGDEKAGGELLEDAPDADEWDGDEDPEGNIEYTDYIPQRLRKHLTLSFNEGEHRVANIAFVKVGGLDRLIDTDVAAAEEAVGALVARVQEVANRFDVTTLQSDISEDGFKLILASGVPARLDAEEERLMRVSFEVAALETPLDVAVGTARGPIFAGDLGSRIRRAYTVMGDTVNIAARLAAAAESGTALATAKILDRVTSDFATHRLDPIPLKGKSVPIAPFVLDGVAATATSWDAGTTPLIGREVELAQMLEVTEKARSGAGRSVSPVGYAGIGKTRLVQEVVHTCSLECLVATSEPYESETAYFVVGRLVQLALGFGDDAAPSAEEVIEAVGRHAPELSPWVPLVGRVLGRTIEDTPEVADLDDQFQGSKTDEVIEELFTAVLTEPTLLVVDGAEWVDEASQATLSRIASNLEDHPWALIMTRRPGELWEDETWLSLLDVGPLADDDARDLLMRLLGDDVSLPMSRIDQILERAGGNPFFLVELAKAIHDGADELPESIEAAAARRIDLLALRDRRLLRYAAVLGQTFSLDLLADALPDVAGAVEDPDVWNRLSEFVATTATGKVRFRQPILRDAAYAGLPYSRRSELHRSVGEALVRRARNRPERFAEQLSVHFFLSGDHEKAWEYSVMAAERASKKYANIVAADLYTRALEAGAELGDAIDPAERLRVSEALGDVSDLAGLHERAWDAFEAARDLAADELARGRLLRKLGMVKEKMGDYAAAKELVTESLQTIESLDAPDDHERFESLVALAGVEHRMSEFDASTEVAMRVVDEADHDELPLIVAHAYNLVEANYLSTAHPDAGIYHETALEIYKAEKDLIGQAKVLNNMGNAAYWKGDWDTSIARWEESAVASEKGGDLVTAAIVTNNLAEVELDRGDYDEARAKLLHALRVCRGAHYVLGVIFAQGNLGIVESRSGNFAEAAGYLLAAETGFAEMGAQGAVADIRTRRLELAVRMYDRETFDALVTDLEAAEDKPGAELLLATRRRLEGYMAALDGDIAAARTAFERARELATTAGSVIEEGRALAALAELERVTDAGGTARSEAEAILSPLGVPVEPVVTLD